MIALANSMAIPILHTKLHIPDPRPGLVPRPRLLARLDEGAARQLTLIAAPAGYGKTTLVAAWIANLRSRQADHPPPVIAWLSLDSSDDDPARFLTYLEAALQKAHASLEAAPLSGTTTPEAGGLRSQMVALINRIGYGGCEVVTLPILLLRKRYPTYCIPLVALDAVEKVVMDNLPLEEETASQ